MLNPGIIARFPYALTSLFTAINFSIVVSPSIFIIRGSKRLEKCITVIDAAVKPMAIKRSLIVFLKAPYSIVINERKKVKARQGMKRGFNLYKTYKGKILSKR
jgi:hypothetical protein